MNARKVLVPSEWRGEKEPVIKLSVHKKTQEESSAAARPVWQEESEGAGMSAHSGEVGRREIPQGQKP